MLMEEVRNMTYTRFKTIPKQMKFCQDKINGLLILLESLPKDKEYDKLMNQLTFFTNIERTLAEYNAAIDNTKPFKTDKA